MSPVQCLGYMYLGNLMKSLMIWRTGECLILILLRKRTILRYLSI